MMGNTVREIGRLDDFDGKVLRIGIDYDSVTIGDHFRLSASEWAQFMGLFAEACWAAAAVAAQQPDERAVQRG